MRVPSSSALLPSALLLAGFAFGQDGSVTLTGTVTGSNGLPLRKATVTLQMQRAAEPASGPASYVGTTDGGGAFAFDSIRAGTYTLSAEHVGYLRGFYGSKAGSAVRGTATPLNLVSGSGTTTVKIQLAEQATVSGKVVDADGDPVPRAQVRLLRSTWVQGKRRLAPDVFTQANDIGEFRLSGVATGRYFLTAEAQTPQLLNVKRVLRSGETESTPVLTWYPGITNEQSAVQLQISAGEDLRGMDIRMASATVVHVRGRVSGTIPARSRVSMYPSAATTLAAQILNAPPMKDGAFEFSNVTPGQWTVALLGNDGPAQVLGSRTITVGAGDVEEVTLTANPPPRLNGMIRMQGDENQPVQRARISLAPENLSLPGAPSGNSDEEGRFQLPGVGAGVYRLTVGGLAAGAFVKAATLNGLDVIERGLDISGNEPVLDLQITVSAAGASLNGTALEAEGKTASGAVVTLTPDPPNLERPERYQRATADQNGTFSFTGVVPGKYLITAWDELEAGEEFDPELLGRTKKHSVPFTAAEGEPRATIVVTY